MGCRPAEQENLQEIFKWEEFIAASSIDLINQSQQKVRGRH